MSKICGDGTEIEKLVSHHNILYNKIRGQKQNKG